MFYSSPASFTRINLIVCCRRICTALVAFQLPVESIDVVAKYPPFNSPNKSRQSGLVVNSSLEANLISYLLDNLKWFEIFTTMKHTNLKLIILFRKFVSIVAYNLIIL